MENHRASDAHQEKTENESQVLGMAKANTKREEDDSENPPKKWYFKPILPQIKWKEIGEILALVVAFIVCAIYWKQLNVMSGQLREIQGGSSQTSQLIANAAHEASNSDKSLKATIDNFHLEQRAWIGVKQIVVGPLNANEPLKIDVVLTNTGKTIGTVTSTISKVLPSFHEEDIDKFISSPEWMEKDRERRMTPPRVTLVFPNFEFAFQILSPGPLYDWQAKSIQSGQIQIYVFGDIYYSDVFGRSHFTKFCGFYVPSAKMFGTCKSHNSAD
jgi:hypothetical protein